MSHSIALTKFNLQRNWPAPVQHQANGTLGCETMSPWQQQSPRLYVSDQPQTLVHSRVSVVSHVAAQARWLIFYNLSQHVLPPSPGTSESCCVLRAASDLWNRRSTRWKTVKAPAVIWQDTVSQLIVDHSVHSRIIIVSIFNFQLHC